MNPRIPRICFIHIPKCGGTSIRNAFSSLDYFSGEGHQSDRAHEQMFPDQFDGFITQTRHPYSRIVSEFNFMHKQYQKFPLMRPELEQHINLDINQWVSLLGPLGEDFQAIDKSKGYFHPRYGLKPQTWYVRNRSTELFKLEDYSIWTYLWKIGIKVPVTWSRQSLPTEKNPVLQTVNSLTYYSRELIRDKYYNDFKELGYEG